MSYFVINERLEATLALLLIYQIKDWENDFTAAYPHQSSTTVNVV